MSHTKIFQKINFERLILKGQSNNKTVSFSKDFDAVSQQICMNFDAPL